MKIKDKIIIIMMLLLPVVAEAREKVTELPEEIENLGVSVNVVYELYHKIPESLGSLKFYEYQWSPAPV